jgi:hypothetical protein
MFQTAMLRILPCLAGLLALFAGTARADDPPAATAPLPLSTTASLGNYEAAVSKPLTIAQQRARFEADQRMMRIQWNKWIGYEPHRPALHNALTNNEMNPYYMQPTRYRPVWGVWNYGSRPW